MVILATILPGLVTYIAFTMDVELPCENPKLKYTFVPLPCLKCVLTPVIVTFKFCPKKPLLGVTETNFCEKDKKGKNANKKKNLLIYKNELIKKLVILKCN